MQSSGEPSDDCLHCQILDLVEARIQAGDTDLAELTSLVAESLAEMILLAPPGDQTKLMADVLMHLGHAFLEKSGAIEGEGSGARH
jgi:hypothetical protein